MGVAHKLRKIMEQKFPSPDKIEIRHDDRMIVMITSKRFRRMSTMKRQDYVHDILMAELTHAAKTPRRNHYDHSVVVADLDLVR